MYSTYLRAVRTHMLEVSIPLLVALLQARAFIEKLPVSSFHTELLTRGTPADDIINMLEQLDTCPNITIHASFCNQLTLEHWERLVHLPIAEVIGGFAPEFSRFREFNDLVKQIDPPPKLTLCVVSRTILPEQMWHMKDLCIIRVSSDCFDDSCNIEVGIDNGQS